MLEYLIAQDTGWKASQNGIYGGYICSITGDIYGMPLLS